MQSVVEFLFKSILINDEKLKVEKGESDVPNTEIFDVTVPKDEMGRIIGKNGSIIKAIRLIASISTRNSGKYLRINLVEV